jgi:hypothetical protein
MYLEILHVDSSEPPVSSDACPAGIFQLLEAHTRRDLRAIQGTRPIGYRACQTCA